MSRTQKKNNLNVIEICFFHFKYLIHYLSISVLCGEGTSANPNSPKLVFFFLLTFLLCVSVYGADSMMPTEKCTLIQGQSMMLLTGEDGVKTSTCSWTTWTSGSHRESN